MRFQVPQFIQVEDKIVGPLSLKQFIYLAGGGALCFILFKILPVYLSFLFILPAATLSLALAFKKFGTLPFIVVFESSLRYLVGSKLYIWKKEEKPIVHKMVEKNSEPLLYVPKLSNSKLKDLTWSLDIAEGSGATTRADTSSTT